MHRLGVAIVVLVAVGVAIVWLWSGEEGAPTRAPGAVARAPEPTSPAIEVERAAIEAPAPDDAAVRGVDSATLLVRVVDAQTERPVAGATVRTLALVDEATVDAAALDEAFLLDEESCIEAFGVTVSCDEHGEAILPRPRGPRRFWRSIYVARAGERFGRSELDNPRATGLVVRVDRDRHADVLVVDAHGEPAPDVAVVHRVSELATALPTGRTWTVRTDERGRVRLPHLHTHVIAVEQSSMVGIQAPGLDVQPIALDCLAPPHEPLRFVLPPSGAVEITDEGPPELTDGRGFSLAPKSEPRLRGSARCRTGRVRFPFVGLGREYELLVEARSGARTYAVTGPTRMGETVVFTVPRLRGPVLGVRLIDARGEPVGGFFGFDVEVGDSITAMGRGVGPDGESFLLLGAESRGRTLIAVRAATDHGPLAGSRGELACRDHVLGDFADLGDLRLVDAPLWGAGRALDDAGAAVSGLELKVAVIQGERGAAAPVIRVQDGGRFELRGGEDVRSARLHEGLSRDDGARQIEEVIAAKGETDLVVRFVRHASLDVDFVHERGPQYRLGVVLHPQVGGEPIDGSLFPRTTERGTRYRFERVPAGMYRLTATLLGEDAPIFAVDALGLRPGENRDPRLHAIALRDVRPLRVDLVGVERGVDAPILSGTVWVRGDGVWRGRVFLGARVELLVRGAPVDVLIAAAGFAPIRREGVVADFVAELVPLRTVPVDLIVDGEARAGGTELHVRFVPLRAGTERFELHGAGGRTDPGPAPWLPPAWIRAGVRGEVPHDGPGEYRVLAFRSPRCEPGDGVMEIAPATVSIPASGIAAPLVLRVPASALAR